MKQLRILSLTIENFKGIRHFALQLDGRPGTVYGANATGKTTLQDAFLWLLFGKDSAGRKDFAVQPLDGGGAVAQKGVDTAVTARLDTGSAAVTLRRVYSEKWEKRRGSALAELTGHTTAYYVDDLPVRQNDYRAFVESICPEKTFQALTGAEFFCSALPWQERRRVLFEMAGGVTEDEVLAGCPELEPLRRDRGNHTVEDYKRIQERRRVALNKELDGLPGRIDEAARALVELSGDPEPMQAQANLLRQERQALSDALARGRDGELEAVERALVEKRAEIAELESVNARRKADLRAQQLAELSQRRRPLQARFNDACAEVARLRTERAAAQAEAGHREAECAALRKDYAQAAGETWQGALACPTCRRPYAPEDIRKAQEAFALAQQEKLQAIAARGKEAARRAEEARVRARELEEELSRAEAGRDEAEAALGAAESPVEVPDCPGYQEGRAALQEEAAALEARTQALRERRAGNEKETRARLQELDGRIAQCERELARAEGNRRAQARMQELLDRQKAAGAELEDAEACIALCEAYTRARVRLTEERVDGCFKLVRWKLFDEQINGGLADTCVATVGGVPWPDLNHAMRVNAGLDVVRALGAFYGCTAPVFVDNAESVTRLTPIPAQVIRLVVSAQDAALRVEVDEEEA